MPRGPLGRPAGLEGGADPARRQAVPRVTHFRLAPSGLPRTPTLLPTTVLGARAAPRLCPRPPLPATCRPPGRACGDCLAAFGRAGRVCGPAPAATAPPRDTGRASAAEQEGSGPRRRGAGRPAFLPSIGLAPLRAAALLSSGSPSAAAFFPPGSLLPGRGLACLRLALRPPSFLEARSAAVPTSSQARSPPPPSSSQARSPAAAPQPPRLRWCSRGALLRFSSGVAAGAGR